MTRFIRITESRDGRKIIEAFVTDDQLFLPPQQEQIQEQPPLLENPLRTIMGFIFGLLAWGIVGVFVGVCFFIGVSRYGIL